MAVIMKYKIILLILLIVFSVNVVAEDSEDIKIYNLELEKVFNLVSGIIAAILFLITLIAYKRSHNQRLKYICSAFLVFAIKGFLISHELFFNELSWVDPTASLLDFAILLLFFIGVVKK